MTLVVTFNLCVMRRYYYQGERDLVHHCGRKYKDPVIFLFIFQRSLHFRPRVASSIYEQYRAEQ